MKPHDELAAGSTRWVLANPGKSYVAYTYDCRDRMRGNEMRLIDVANGVAYTHDGNAGFSAAQLAQGVTIHVPPKDWALLEIRNDPQVPKGFAVRSVAEVRELVRREPSAMKK